MPGAKVHRVPKRGLWPGLGQAMTRALAREPIEYELEGTIGVSAGAFGEPVFGPMTILRGDIR